jgi:mannose-6-phosphate isomerase-like protein (cupin superfamily)
MSDYTLCKIDDMEAIVFGSFKRARAQLGVNSFGMQVIDMPPNTDQYPEHDHLHDGQEEVFIVLRGSGELEIDGQRHPIDPETMVRVAPQARRKVWPGEQGMRLLALGGCPGKPYEAPEISKLGSPDPRRPDNLSQQLAGS